MLFRFPTLGQTNGSIETFKGAYLIFMRSDFARSKTCILEGVLFWSILYVVGVGAPLLRLESYIYLREDC